jgi:hypothetical protein
MKSVKNKIWCVIHFNNMDTSNCGQDIRDYICSAVCNRVWLPIAHPVGLQIKIIC